MRVFDRGSLYYGMMWLTSKLSMRIIENYLINMKVYSESHFLSSPRVRWLIRLDYLVRNYKTSQRRWSTTLAWAWHKNGHLLLVYLMLNILHSFCFDQRSLTWIKGGCTRKKSKLSFESAFENSCQQSQTIKREMLCHNSCNLYY